MPQNSTGRIDAKSGISMDEEAYRIFATAKHILEAARGVKHSSSDVFRAIASTVRIGNADSIAVLASSYGPRSRSVKTVVVSRADRDYVYKLAKSKGATISKFVKAAMAVFTMAAVKSLRRSALGSLGGPDVRHVYPVRASGRPSTYKWTKSAPAPIRVKQKNGEKMRYHNYLAIFRDYIQSLGGFERFINRVAVCPIHSLPIKGMPGKETGHDVDIAANPGANYLVRFSSRGRGYNVTVISMTAGPHPGPDTCRHPELDVTVERPSLSQGSVFRLYDLYRNIDWSNVVIQEEE